MEATHASYKLTFKHPYVVIHGQDLHQIRSCYIIVGNHMYQVKSCTDAVNICYQITKTLFNNYSLINNHVWQFIEREVYGNSETKVCSATLKVIEGLNDI